MIIGIRRNGSRLAFYKTMDSGRPLLHTRSLAADFNPETAQMVGRQLRQFFSDAEFFFLTNRYEKIARKNKTKTG